MAQFATYRSSIAGAANESVFSFTAVKETGDIWFHMENPANVQWAAAAIGTQMSNALMFVVYHAGTGNDVTVSARTAQGHRAPTQTDKVCNLVNGPGGNYVNQYMYNVNVHCLNVTTWTNKDGSTGRFDFDAPQTNMIFGNGPQISGNSGGDAGYSISQHTYIPLPFTVTTANATTLTGPGQIPSSQNISTSTGTENYGYLATRPEWIVALHGVGMLLAFLILFPIGTAVMLIWRKVGLHWFFQAFGTAAVIFGFGFGVYKAYDTGYGGHPIFGTVIFVLVLIQAILGTTHHAIYKKTQRRTLLSPIHRSLGVLVLILGVANGIYGFIYAEHTAHVVIVPVVAAGVYLILGAVWFFVARSRRRRQLKTGRNESDPYAPENFKQYRPPTNSDRVALTEVHHEAKHEQVPIPQPYHRS